MPPSLRQHIRYPEDLFKIQADKFLAFHMQDPQVFYNREDSWAVATEKVGNQTAAGRRRSVLRGDAAAGRGRAKSSC